MPAMKTKVQKAIKILMVQNDMDVKDLAKKMGMATMTIYTRIEGRSKWKVEEGYRLAEVLGTTFSHIFGS